MGQNEREMLLTIMILCAVTFAMLLAFNILILGALAKILEAVA